jgi:anaerobic selenocysteine-containing dehydrogenase
MGQGLVHDRVLPSGRWQLAPAPLVEILGAWGSERGADLVLVPRPAVHRMNSALRDVGRGAEDAEVWVHPDDTRRGGNLHDGEHVVVSSDTGTVTAGIRVTDDVVPGAVSFPHWLVEPNVSRLTSSRAGAVDPLTGMITQSGLVRLTCCHGPEDEEGGA